MNSASVRAAWAALFEHSTLQAITGIALAIDVLAGAQSGTEAEALYHQQAVNAFTYIVLRDRRIDQVASGRVVEHSFLVEVSYLHEKDISLDGWGFNECIDALETLDDLVVSVLGPTWSDTVDFHEQQTVNRPALITFDEKPVWRGSVLYTATTQSSL